MENVKVKLNKKILIIVFTVIFLTLLLGIYKCTSVFINEISFVNNSSVATAKVVRVDTFQTMTKNSMGNYVTDTSYVINVEYQVNNNPITSKYNIGKKTMAVDSEIKIRYKLDNPEEIRLIKDIFLVHSILGMVLALVITICCIAWFRKLIKKEM